MRNQTSELNSCLSIEFYFIITILFLTGRGTANTAVCPRDISSRENDISKTLHRKVNIQIARYDFEMRIKFCTLAGLR